MDPQIKLKPLLGQTLHCIEGAVPRHEDVIFTGDTKRWHMHHNQDCCENVAIENVEGDIANLIGSPVLSAREEIDSGNGDYSTWTRTSFIITTAKGSVTVTWLGESNGYYGEGVEFYEVKEEQEP